MCTRMRSLCRVTEHPPYCTVALTNAARTHHGAAAVKYPPQCMLRHVDAFAGLGGFTRALESVSTPMAYCEIDPDAQAVLLSQMSTGGLPQAPIVPGIKDLSAFLAQHKLPDVLCAGFPCMGFSSCGLRQGFDDPRTAQFQHVMRALRKFRVPIVILENSPNVARSEKLFAGFHRLGYQWCATLASAFMVGSPQNRVRWYAMFVQPDSVRRLRKLVLQVSTYRFREPARTVRTKVAHSTFVRRYSLLGRTIVPPCAQLAITHLAKSLLENRYGMQALPKMTKPDLSLVLTQADLLIRRRVWPTPTSSSPGTCNRLTYRISGDLPSAVKFESRTIPGQLNLAWVEWLMRYPPGWTAVLTDTRTPHRPAATPVPAGHPRLTAGDSNHVPR